MVFPAKKSECQREDLLITKVAECKKGGLLAEFEANRLKSEKDAIIAEAVNAVKNLDFVQLDIYQMRPQAPYDLQKGGYELTGRQAGRGWRTATHW